ncbi:MAG TPA: hypothetical protein VM755_19795 [Stellaceae bacterium]|nr:hypothetical protein [Stellaceae bacterium]
MSEIISKSEYAERRGVGESAVSNWIARGQLTPPALQADGSIDADLADEQRSRRRIKPRRLPRHCDH